MLESENTPLGTLRYELFYTKRPADILPITAIIDLWRFQNDGVGPIVLRLIGERITFTTVKHTDSTSPGFRVVSESQLFVCFKRVIWDSERDAEDLAHMRKYNIRGMHCAMGLLIPPYAPPTSPPSRDPHADVIRYYLELECAWTDRAHTCFSSVRRHIERHPVEVVPHVAPLSASEAASQRSPGVAPWRTYIRSKDIPTRTWPFPWRKGLNSRAHIELRLPNLPSLPMATDIQLMLSITTRTEFLDVRDIHDGGDKLLKTLPAPPTSATAIAIRLVRAVSVQASDCEWRVTLPIRPGDVRSTVRPRDMHVDGPVWEPPVLPCDSSATIRGMETLSTPREDAERAGAGAKRCVQCVHYAATLRLSVPRIALTEKIARDSAPYYLFVHIPFSGLGNDLKACFPVNLGIP